MEKNLTENGSLPVLLSDNFFIFPSCKEFLNLEKKATLKKVLADSWNFYGGKILVVSSKFPLEENELDTYVQKNFFEYGSLAKIDTDFSKDADLEVILNSLREVQITGVERVKLANFRKSDSGEYYCADYQIFRDNSLAVFNQQGQQKTKSAGGDIMKKLTTLLSGMLQKSDNSIPYLVFSSSSENVSDMIDFFIQSNKSLSREFKQTMIEEYRIEDRLKILTDLDKEIRKADRDVKERTNEKLINQQTSAYLREQMSSISSQIREIEGTKNEKDSILEKVEKEPFPEYVREAVRNELENYERTSSYSPEAGMIRGYIDWVISLPWYQCDSDKNLEFSSIKKSLDEDHYGLSKVKERIVEYFAVLQNKNSNAKGSLKKEEENE